MRKPILLTTAFIALLSFLATAQDINPIHGRRMSGIPSNNLGGGSGTNSSGQSGTGANIDVLYHKIFWRISPDSTKYIKGYVQTNFKTITGSVTTLTFDLNSVLVVDSVRFRGAKLAAGNITRSGNIVTIALGATLANNFIDSLTIWYQGVPPGLAYISGAVGYQKTSDAGAGNYIYTLSESYEDRDWWPCKADMKDKIDSMDMTVSVPWASPTAADTFWVACNGKLVDSTISGGSRLFTFKTRYPIASYLVAVAVARYNKYYRSVNVNGTIVPVEYNIFKGKGSYTTILSKLDSMNLALIAFSNKLGDYPFKNEKSGFYEGIDAAAGAGGMEHQTFSSIETAAMADAKTLSHELMHQWFGDNVSFGTWNDLWLAEGFAAYAESTLFPEFVTLKPAYAYTLRNSKKSSAQGSNVSAWIPNASAGTSAIWNSSYGSSVYTRGCMVVSMLRAIAGDTKFFQALTNYQTNLSGKSASTDSLKNYFNTILGADISEFFNDYVGGSGAAATAVGGIGYPTNNMTWNTLAGNKLVVKLASQARSPTNNVTYFNGPIVMHFTNAASGWTKDTTITIFDWGGGSLSYAGNGLGDPIPGNALNFDLSFTPTNAFYDDSARTLASGTMAKDATFMGYQWSGATSSAWNTSTNWASCCAVPPSGAQVTINTTVNQPVLPGTITVGGLYISAGSKLNIGNNTLVINGAVTGTGTITGSATSGITINDAAGTLNFDQTSAATRSLNNITINSGGSATLGSAVDVYGTITLTGATLNLNAKNLTLRSTSSGTASIAGLTGSTLSGATNVTVERYIPANVNRAWRLLAAPTTGQTIKAAWQENQAAGATTPAGYGTQISSSSAAWAANGFDMQTAGDALKTYNAATGAWVGVTATTSAINSTSAYMLYIRGDRSCLISNSTITPTIMRTTGSIYQGTQTAINVTSNKYALIGNILPSAIDFRNVTRTGGTDAVFYVWDPKLVGTYGLGAYQTFTLSGGNYLVTPGGGSYGVNGSINNTIQSGQGFFVHATGSAGTVQLAEACKTSGSSMVFGPTGAPGEQLITNLYAVTGTGNQLADGTLTLYDIGNSNAIDGNDAQKLTNSGENLGMMRNGTVLAAEQRMPVNPFDTIFYNISGLRQQDYQLEFVANNMDHPGLTGRLIDNYLGTSTPVNLNNTTTVNFTVNADPASSNASRFMMVFFNAPLPVSFTGIKAYQQGTNVALEWKVGNQINIQKYEVERSADGAVFSKQAEQAATGTNGSDATYTWLDVNPINGDNFYRVRSIGIGGDIKYSTVVKVNMAKGTRAITVYPNPVSNHTIGIQFADMEKGIYQLRLINTLGQVVLTQSISHNGGSASQTISINNSVLRGYYRLEIMKPGGEKVMKPLYVSE